MIALAVDPGSNLSGFAIGEILPYSSTVKLLAHGDIKMQAGSLPVKMLELQKDLCDLISGHGVRCLIYETPFFPALKNESALLGLASAVIACQWSAHLHGLNCHSIKVSEWRRVLGIKKEAKPKGWGQTQLIQASPEGQDIKKVTRNYVCRAYDLPVSAFNSFDHSDALAILTAFPRLFEVVT